MKRFGRGLGALAAACAAMLALGAAPPEADGPRCRGLTPTVVGTDGDDLLWGTNGRDVIWGGRGDDRIYGLLGNDVICGGPGADVLHGGRGNDVLDGGAGDGDQVYGDLGDDTVLGGPGDYDEVSGGLGIDIVRGGPGSGDVVHGDYGWDLMDGGPGGGDIASFATDVGAPREGGVWVSLREGIARGDGRDRLSRFEGIEGSAFNDTLIGDKRDNWIWGGAGDDLLVGGGGRDHLFGERGSDRCRGAKGRTISCGPERRPKASAYVEIDTMQGGGGGLALLGRGGDDDFTVAFDPASNSFGVTAKKGIAIGRGCTRVSAVQVSCRVDGPARWVMADLGPGNDRLRVEGSLAGAENVRIAGGPGDDVIRGGPEDDLIEAGRGADRLYGGAGSDGLIGNLPGPTFLYGEEHGDLLAAGGGCAGGAIVGGPGRDNASFAETQAHPGLLYISLAHGKAWIDVVRGCRPVRLDKSIEDIEGSFDDDVLIGNRRKNALLGQPGRDRFFGGGGDDVIDARDSVRDFHVQCGPRGRSGRALTDRFDPPVVNCALRKDGDPIPGLDHATN